MPGRGAYPNQSARITRPAVTRKREDGVRPALLAHFFSAGSTQAVAGSAVGLASANAHLRVLRLVFGSAFAGSLGEGGLTRALGLTGSTSGGGITSGTSRLVRGLLGVVTTGSTAGGTMWLMRTLAAAAAGFAEVRGQWTPLRALAGAGHSASELFGRMAGRRGFTGQVAGWSSVAGLLLSAVRTILARMVFVRREARTVVVGFESRAIQVDRERLVVTPAADPRTLAVREDKRQFDA